MLTMSENVNEIAGALAMAQGEVENASKNAANPHFKSRYADLAEVLNTVRPALAKYGICVVQSPSLDGDIASVTTVLAHKSGQWFRGVASARIGKTDPQGVGSAITYLRRYSLAAVVGIAQEDDDANAASVPPASRPAAQSRFATAVPAPAVHPSIAGIVSAGSLDDLKARYLDGMRGATEEEGIAITAAKDQRKKELAQ